MTTPTALDWVQTLGLGSITGAVLGAWLTRLGQRRQFRWQIKAQRIEAALVSYTECYKLTGRIRDQLHLNPGETLRETWSIERGERLVHLTEQLEDREVELHARDAAEVADVFADVRTTAWTFVGFAGAVDKMDDPRIKDLHVRTMRDLHELIKACQARWTEWEGKQLPPRWRPSSRL